jgi:glyoxylase-like metal-dependent hydrolase (beta-lactamase superfamily II)
MLFQQVRNAPSGAYSYILGDRDRRAGLVIDPVVESQDVLLALIGDLGIELHFILLTHTHPGSDQSALALRNRAGGAIVTGADCKTVVGDMPVRHGEYLAFGDEIVHVIGTPGHTPCSVCYRWRDRLFTGDTLLLGSCGDAASPGSDAGRLFDSVTNRLFMLPPETLVFPGLDPNGRTVSTIAEEKSSNPRFNGRSRDAFVTHMSAVPSPAFPQPKAQT